MQKITIPHDLPMELHSLANSAIDMAIGMSPKVDLEPLHDWLLWESNNYEDLEVFIFLDEFDLSDSALHAELENKNALIDDDMRVAYARKQVAHSFKNQARYDFSCCCAYKLQRENKDNTYVCAITHNLGQGGLEADWLGFFPTAIDFWDHLETLGGCRMEGDQIIFNREAILKNWSRGLPPRLVFSRTEKNVE
jgi:hypothetical protein